MYLCVWISPSQFCCVLSNIAANVYGKFCAPIKQSVNKLILLDDRC